MTSPSPLRVALRTVSAAALVVAATGLFVRGVEAMFDPFAPYPGATSDYGVERARAIRAALPAIAERDGKTTIVLGSSSVARAFVPSVFDATLAATGTHETSYNFAQLLLQPETTLAMAKVVRKTYEARDKRLAMTIVGISVPELSHTSLQSARRIIPNQPFAFATAGTVFDRARTDPAGAFGDGLDLLVFGNVRPARLGLWLQDWAGAEPPGCNSGFKQPPENPESYAALVDYCNELHRQFPKGTPAWDPNTRGWFDFGLPATRPALEQLVAHQPSWISAPLATAPPEDETDEDAVRTLIAAVRELAAVSDATFVMRDVLNPALLAPVPPERLEHWRDVAERIARESEATLLDVNDGAVSAADFGDRTHLHPLAAERFTAALAARVRPTIERHNASR